MKMYKCASLVTATSSLRSGLKHYHGFMTEVLGVDPARTLPPKSSAFVNMWLVGCFANAGTAPNYFARVKWACTYALGEVGPAVLEWYDDSVKMTLKGLEKVYVKHHGGPARCPVLLTDQWVQWMMEEYYSKHNQMAMCIIACWEFLLRAQSEGLTMYKGTPNDAISMQGRPSGVWIVDETTMVLRLLKRKTTTI